MKWKKIGNTLLFPPTLLRILLTPFAVFCLLYTMAVLPENDPIRICAYVLAFYTLTIWCVQIPGAIRFFRQVKQENHYAQLWANSPRLRVNVSLSGSLLWNSAYALLQLGLGIYHRSFWFYTLSGYHLSLALMRFFLLRYTVRHRPGEKPREELVRYRACGWAFLAMNLALSAMIFFMVFQERYVRHHEIIAIAMAAYTFTTLTKSIIDLVQYRKLGSPVFSAAKAISLASACVSMLTLEGTMLSTFHTADMTMQLRQLFLGLSGMAVSILIVAMALYMIVKGSRELARI